MSLYCHLLGLGVGVLSISIPQSPIPVPSPSRLTIMIIKYPAAECCTEADVRDDSLSGLPDHLELDLSK